MPWMASVVEAVEAAEVEEVAEAAEVVMANISASAAACCISAAPIARALLVCSCVTSSGGRRTMAASNAKFIERMRGSCDNGAIAATSRRHSFGRFSARPGKQSNA